MKKDRRMNEIKDVCKRLVGFFLPFVGIMFSIIIYFYTFPFINKVDPSIYSLYASNGAYEFNPYFSSEINKSTKIIQTLIDNFDMKSIKDIRDVHRLIIENPNKTTEVISSNKVYMDYLKDKKLTIDDMIQYSKRFDDIDKAIIDGSLYFLSIVVILIYALWYKARIKIYCVGAVIYLISGLSNFTNNLSGFTIIKLLMKLYKSITFNELSDSMDSTFPVVKEAILTYIIIDVIITYLQEKKYRYRNYLIRAFYYNLVGIITDIERYNLLESNIVFKRFNNNIDVVIKYFKKNRNLHNYLEITQHLNVLISNVGEIQVANEEFYNRVNEIINLMRSSRDFQEIIY